jgi:hypothetical protein
VRQEIARMSGDKVIEWTVVAQAVVVAESVVTVTEVALIIPAYLCAHCALALLLKWCP